MNSLCSLSMANTCSKWSLALLYAAPFAHAVLTLAPDADAPLLLLQHTVGLSSVAESDAVRSAALRANLGHATWSTSSDGSPCVAACHAEQHREASWSLKCSWANCAGCDECQVGDVVASNPVASDSPSDVAESRPEIPAPSGQSSQVAQPSAMQVPPAQSVAAAQASSGQPAQPSAMQAPQAQNFASAAASSEQNAPPYSAQTPQGQNLVPAQDQSKQEAPQAGMAQPPQALMSPTAQVASHQVVQPSAITQPLAPGQSASEQLAQPFPAQPPPAQPLALQPTQAQAATPGQEAPGQFAQPFAAQSPQVPAGALQPGQAQVASPGQGVSEQFAQPSSMQHAQGVPQQPVEPQAMQPPLGMLQVPQTQQVIPGHVSIPLSAQTSQVMPPVLAQNLAHSASAPDPTRQQLGMIQVPQAQHGANAQHADGRSAQPFAMMQPLQAQGFAPGQAVPGQFGPEQFAQPFGMQQPPVQAQNMPPGQAFPEQPAQPMSMQFQQAMMQPPQAQGFAMPPLGQEQFAQPFGIQPPLAPGFFPGQSPDGQPGPAPGMMQLPQAGQPFGMMPPDPQAFAPGQAANPGSAPQLPMQPPQPPYPGQAQFGQDQFAQPFGSQPPPGQLPPTALLQPEARPTGPCDFATEVRFDKHCYYLDGSGGKCDNGYELAPQWVFKDISAKFGGKKWRHQMASSCCISHKDESREGQDFGLMWSCGKPDAKFKSNDISRGAKGCIDAHQQDSAQLTLCVSTEERPDAVSLVEMPAVHRRPHSFNYGYDGFPAPQGNAPVGLIQQISPRSSAQVGHTRQVPAQDSLPTDRTSQSLPQSVVAMMGHMSQTGRQSSVADSSTSQAPPQNNAPNDQMGQTAPQGSADMASPSNAPQQESTSQVPPQSHAQLDQMSQSSPQGNAQTNFMSQAPSQSNAQMFSTSQIPQQSIVQMNQTSQVAPQGAAQAGPSSQATLQGISQTYSTSQVPRQSSAQLDQMSQSPPQGNTQSNMINQASSQGNAQRFSTSQIPQQSNAQMNQMSQAPPQSNSQMDPMSQAAASVNAQTYSTSQAPPQGNALTDQMSQSSPPASAQMNYMGQALAQGNPQMYSTRELPPQGSARMDQMSQVARQGDAQINAMSQAPSQVIAQMYSTSQLPPQSNAQMNQMSQVPSQSSAAMGQETQAAPQGTVQTYSTSQAPPQASAPMNQISQPSPQGFAQMSDKSQVAPQANDQMNVVSQAAPQGTAPAYTTSQAPPQSGAQLEQMSQSSPQGNAQMNLMSQAPLQGNAQAPSQVNAQMYSTSPALPQDQVQMVQMSQAAPQGVAQLYSTSQVPLQSLAQTDQMSQSAPPVSAQSAQMSQPPPQGNTPATPVNQLAPQGNPQMNLMSQASAQGNAQMYSTSQAPPQGNAQTDQMSQAAPQGSAQMSPTSQVSQAAPQGGAPMDQVSQMSQAAPQGGAPMDQVSQISQAAPQGGAPMDQLSQTSQAAPQGGAPMDQLSQISQTAPQGGAQMNGMAQTTSQGSAQISQASPQGGVQMSPVSQALQQSGAAMDSLGPSNVPTEYLRQAPAQNFLPVDFQRQSPGRAVSGQRECDAATEVSHEGYCYYLDGSGGRCDEGYELAPQAVLNSIGPLFVGRTYKHSVSNNCCVAHQAQNVEGQDFGMHISCDQPTDGFKEGDVTYGGRGCHNAFNLYDRQLTLCVSSASGGSVSTGAPVDCYSAGNDMSGRDDACGSGLVCARKGSDGRSFGCDDAYCCSQIPEGSLQLHSTECLRAGDDPSSRDAACGDGLVCARNGHDGRQFGDCEGDHCCTQIPQTGLPAGSTDCFNAGTDLASRDAACVGELVCARWGFDDREVGDCENDHCCSRLLQNLPHQSADCYRAGYDLASRDAACSGDLVCARPGFDGREFGDCADDHCCSNDPTAAHGTGQAMPPAQGVANSPYAQAAQPNMQPSGGSQVANSADASWMDETQLHASFDAGTIDQMMARGAIEARQNPADPSKLLFHLDPQVQAELAQRAPQTTAGGTQSINLEGTTVPNVLPSAQRVMPPAFPEAAKGMAVESFQEHPQAQRGQCPTLFVAVMSSQENAQRRAAVRGMWRDADLGYGNTVQAKFVVCVHGEVPAQLQLESNSHNDLLFLDCDEGYANGALTRKVAAAMRAFLALGTSDLFMKTDDDTWVSTRRLCDFMNQQQAEGKDVMRSYMGVFYEGSEQIGSVYAPVRDPSSPQYEPVESYQDPAYPLSAKGGPGYILPRRLVEAVVNVGLPGQGWLNNEDKAVGMWVQKISTQTQVLYINMPGTDGVDPHAVSAAVQGRFADYPFIMHHHLPGDAIACMHNADMTQDAAAKWVSPCFPQGVALIDRTTPAVPQSVSSPEARPTAGAEQHSSPADTPNGGLSAGSWWGGKSWFRFPR